MSSTVSGSKNKIRKRKNAQSHEGARKRQKNADLPPSERLPKHGFPSDHPFNTNEYRYCLAEPDPHVPDNDPETDYAKPIPARTYRILQHNIPLLSPNDRASQLHLGSDRLTATGEKGYAMVRGTHGVRCDYWSGKSWYYEVELVSLPIVNEAAVRVGFAQAQADGQCPTGYDDFGYAIRSKKGTIFHKSKGKSYTNKKGFEEGDIIGCEIFMPQEKQVSKTLPDTLKEATLVKFKSFYYFESRTNKKAKDQLAPCKGSWIQFYRNGVPLGKAFENINEGVYYPSISLFKTAKVKVNFGPTWNKPPKTEDKIHPFHEMGFRGEVNQSVSDLLFAVDLKINGII